MPQAGLPVRLLREATGLVATELPEVRGERDGEMSEPTEATMLVAQKLRREWGEKPGIDADKYVAALAQALADEHEAGRVEGIQHAYNVACNVARECAVGFMPGSPVGRETANDIALRILALPPEVKR